MCWGKLFQIRAAATEKARSPTNDSRVRPTISEHETEWRCCQASSWLRDKIKFVDKVQRCRPVKTFLPCVRRYALHGLSYRNSVRPSVHPSVTLVDCVHMVRPTIMISSPYGSSIILVSGDMTFIPKFKGGHPSEGVE